MQTKAEERMAIDGLGCPKTEEEQARLVLVWWGVSGRGTRLWVRGTLHEGWGETREIFRWRGRTWVPLE